MAKARSTAFLPALPAPSVSEVQKIDSPATPSIVRHAQTASTLLTRGAARAFGNGLATAGLAPHLLNPQTWDELLQLQGAVVRRLQQQNQDWLNGCAALAREYDRLKGANTISKLAEQQFNLVAQWGKLVSDQATSLIELQENISVDYGYWASQKLNA
jgi:hypothetical protein